MTVVRFGARLGAALALVVAGSLVLAQSAQALTLTTLNTESFTGAATSSPNWVKPSGTNGACLTAGSNTTQLPIPGCQSSALDPTGSGTLRLTTNVNNAVGTVFSTVSLPTAQGLDITFDSYQYATGSAGADGIAFLLAATDPTNPSPPAINGPLGGSLGYSAAGSTPGVSDGYIGFGLDVFGNFSSSSFGGTGCPTTSAVPESITVRGPGNGTAGYCVLSTTPVSAGGLDKASATSRPAPVPVEIALNPGPATTTSSGLAVGADSWAMQVGTYNGTKLLGGTLPSMAGIAPSDWLNGSGLPYQLTFGWAASTGADNEIHEINTLTSTTVNGPLPVYGLSTTDNESGQFLAGNQAVVSVTPTLDPSQGTEANPATVTTTFPAGITPQAGPFTTNGYSCKTSGQTVTCTYTPGTAVSSLPTADIGVSIASGTAAGNYTITSKVSSTDANPATASHTVTVSQFSAAASGTITYGADETLSVAGIPTGATGSVTFTDATGATLCTIPDVTTKSSCVVSSPAAGVYTVTASYTPGSGSPYASQSAQTGFTVNKATTTFSAAATPATTTYGNTSVLSASGLPAAATGTVEFRDASNTLLCTATLPTTSCSTSASLATDSYAITATYSGDANYTGSTATTTLGVGKATVALSATVSDPSVSYGDTDTLSYSGPPVSGAVAATGTVEFRDAGNTLLCTATLPATSCQTAATLPAGSYTVTATYSGDANYTSAVAAAVSMMVTKAGATLTATAASPTITYGDTDTLSYSGLTLSGPTAATGTVEFRDADNTLLCTATLPATSCQTAATLPAGSYTVTATYSGDANHATETAASFAVTVGQHGSSGLAAAATPTSVSYGTSDTLSYSGLTLSGPTAATGTVEFRDAGNTLLCTATLPATSCATSTALPAGHYDVTATYSGDRNYSGSTASTAFDVARVATAISAAASDPSVSYGTSDTLSYSGLTLSGPTAATGTVEVRDADNTLLCTATLPATSCATSTALPAGDYDVTATYSGDANHEGSGDHTSFEVTKAATSVTAADATGTHGTATTLTAGGLPTSGANAATGTVTFADSDGTVLCTATLPDVSCAAPASLAVGDHHITVTYSGDANHEGSTTTADLDIARGSFPLVATLSTSRATVGQPVTITVHGVPADASGTITVTSRGDTVCTIRLPGTSCAIPTTLGLGQHSLVVTFPGDSNYDPSTATTTLTVVAVPHTTSRVTGTTGHGGTTASIPVPHGPGVTVTVVRPPAHGSVKIVDGILRYTADPGFSGTDTVTYRVRLADGATRLVTVTIVVPRAPASANGSGGAALARTGTDLRTPLLVGAGLIAAGTITLAATRRRRPTP